MQPDIIALGEPLIEFVALDETRDGAPLHRQGFGGDISNAMIAAARQGAKAGVVSAVGNDPFGAALRGLWQREGVDASAVIDSDAGHTGVYFVQPDASGRSFSYARKGSAASRYARDDLPVEAIKAAKILHVSAISQAISGSMRDAVREAARIARGAGTQVSYDTNLRLNLWPLEEAKAEIEAFSPLADIVFPSDDEARLLTGLEDVNAIIDFYLGFGAKLVCLKRGEAGAVLASPDGRTTIAPHPTTAVDSTGAGDAYAGAFLAYYLETGNADLAARRAAIVAAGTVSGLGAIDPIPMREAVLAAEV